MYKQHPVFQDRISEDVKVWRYMDFTKFVSLLDTQCLHFSRCDKFNDPFEGSYPKINVEARKHIPKELADHKDTLQHAHQAMQTVSKNLPRFVAINCWHESAYESAAMWKLYLKSDEGIAVQSTLCNLKKSITDEEPVYIGQIKYIDYENEFIPEGNILAPFVHKRKSFEHEKEVRALIIKFPSKLPIETAESTIQDGLPIKVDVNTLIENVYISPYAQIWFMELVRSVIDKYGFKFSVHQSNLNVDPVF